MCSVPNTSPCIRDYFRNNNILDQAAVTGNKSIHSESYTEQWCMIILHKCRKRVMLELHLEHLCVCASTCVRVVLTTVSSDEATQIMSTSNRTMTPSTNLLFWAPHSTQLILHTHKHNVGLTYELTVYVTLCTSDAQMQNKPQRWRKGPYRAGRIRNGHACLCQPFSLRSTSSTSHSRYMQSTKMRIHKKREWNQIRTWDLWNPLDRN